MRQSTAIVLGALLAVLPVWASAADRYRRKIQRFAKTDRRSVATPRKFVTTGAKRTKTAANAARMRTSSTATSARRAGSIVVRVVAPVQVPVRALAGARRARQSHRYGFPLSPPVARRVGPPAFS